MSVTARLAPLRELSASSKKRNSLSFVLHHGAHHLFRNVFQRFRSVFKASNRFATPHRLVKTPYSEGRNGLPDPTMRIDVLAHGRGCQHNTMNIDCLSTSDRLAPSLKVFSLIQSAFDDLHVQSKPATLVNSRPRQNRDFFILDAKPRKRTP